MNNNVEMREEFRQENPYHAIPNNERYEYPMAKGVRARDEEMMINERAEVTMPPGVKLCLILTSICCFTLFFIILLIK
jgi:hypothetical protein